MPNKTTKSANKNLHEAKKAKKVEFYTQLSDIENELKHYKAHFKDKIVLCNCDDPLASNFFKYFFLNFRHLGLKELICTCYKSQNWLEPSVEDSPKKAYALIIPRDENLPQIENHKGTPLKQIEELLSLSLSRESQQSQKTIKAFDSNIHKLAQVTTELKSDFHTTEPTLFPIYEDKDANNAGDFRSKDCLALLKYSDIVVTNPPFSLFREYVATLIEYEKKFVIIMPLNSITYKEIFSLIKNNQLWLGYGFRAGNAYFKPANANPQDFAKGVYDENTGLVKFRNVTWGTNLEIKKRSEILETIYTYEKDKDKYQKYDNYDAINVSKLVEIPMDYAGVMGVPITFLEKHNPKQFEIIKFRKGDDDKDLIVNGKYPYFRILIRQIKSVQELKDEEE